VLGSEEIEDQTRVRAFTVAEVESSTRNFLSLSLSLNFSLVLHLFFSFPLYILYFMISESILFRPCPKIDTTSTHRRRTQKETKTLLKTEEHQIK
jgi:hypothetical protein